MGIAELPEGEEEMAWRAIAFTILAPALRETFGLFADADRQAAEAALRRVEHFAAGVMQAFVDEEGKRVIPGMIEVAGIVRETLHEAAAEIAKRAN